MTPIELFYTLRKILAEECGCSGSWTQHPEPLKAAELTAIRTRILRVLEIRPSEATPRPTDESVAAHA